MNALTFDAWIRGPFVAMNTELEELYFAQEDRANVAGVGDRIKAKLCDEGQIHVARLLAEGNTGDCFTSAFSVLGNVGFYLGALRRHELTNPAIEERSPFPEASLLALQVGATIGMAPRFVSAHLVTRNLAVRGVRKSFTSLKDESVFINENTHSVLGLRRAADALGCVVHLGVSSPIATQLFEDARDALDDVVHFNAKLAADLDVDRFFYCVRPYYKPYRVGRAEYRGVNGGDFSGVNEIDLLLGLISPNNPYYAQLLIDKMPFMLPSDRTRLRECMTYRSLLDELLLLLPDCANEGWFRDNAKAYLAVCDRFAETARQHHDLLVEKYIAKPADDLDAAYVKSVTASGPPLSVLLRSLKRLRDYRCAEPGDETRHDDLAKLRQAVAQ